jgi:hypothetical protein
MDAFELLRRDHVKARMLLDELRRADDPAARDRLLRQLADELRVYEEIEAGCFLPVFSKNRDGLDRARACDEDHEILRRLLGELERSAGQPTWPSALSQLMEAVDRHSVRVAEELLPVARRLIDPRGMVDLTRTMQSQRRTRFARMRGAEQAGAGRGLVRDIADAKF